jgi:hypothetical protein
VLEGAVGATAKVDDAGLEEPEAVVPGGATGPPYCATARAGKRKRANDFVNMLKSW